VCRWRIPKLRARSVLYGFICGVAARFISADGFTQ
jgi:hypothetical protein